MSMPKYGEIWLVDLDPTRGREQAKTRPCLVFSADFFNKSSAQLHIIIPITSTNRGISLHVPIIPPEGGLKNTSYIMCEQIKSQSKLRMIRYIGSVSTSTLKDVEMVVKKLLNIY